MLISKSHLNAQYFVYLSNSMPTLYSQNKIYLAADKGFWTLLLTILTRCSSTLIKKKFTVKELNFPNKLIYCECATFPRISFCPSVLIGRGPGTPSTHVWIFILVYY